MQIKYFEDTDTLYVQLNEHEISETRDLDENTAIDIDKNGHLVAMTIEHAKAVTDISDFSFRHILAKPA